MQEKCKDCGKKCAEGEGYPFVGGEWICDECRQKYDEFCTDCGAFFDDDYKGAAYTSAGLCRSCELQRNS